MYDTMKLKGLFSRVYDANQTTDVDVNEIKEYITKVFGDGSANPDPSLLHQFNTLVVQKADEIAKPQATDILSLLATFKTSPIDRLVQYDIPQKNKAKVVFAAHGTGVDLVRVEGKKSKIAVPQKFQAGFYYEPLDLVRESVDYFRFLIQDVANAKVRMYLDNVSKLVQSAITSSAIPAANVKVGANITFAEYSKIASVLARYGGRPLFIADTLFIDKIAQQQAGLQSGNLLTDRIREELLTALNPTTIGRTTAVNLVNPFTDATNSKTELPVNVGYMFAGGVNQKPFHIVEYGGLRQMTEQDIEDERIKVKITQEAAVELLFGEAVGFLQDDSITL